MEAENEQSKFWSGEGDERVGATFEDVEHAVPTES